MTEFIEWLETANGRDTRVRAVLRRSLAFDPGAYVPAYPYVERFVGERGSVWRRKALYLVAGLWAMHWRADHSGRISLAAALAKCQADHGQATDGSGSIERRFINLLDADEEQVAYRLRQIIALLKDYPVDFATLLQGLLYWNTDDKRTQRLWAREFYRSSGDSTTTTEPSTDGVAT